MHDYAGYALERQDKGNKDDWGYRIVRRETTYRLARIAAVGTDAPERDSNAKGHGGLAWDQQDQWSQGPEGFPSSGQLD